MLACAANRESRVMAWEPVPYLFKKMTANIALMDLVNNATFAPTLFPITMATRHFMFPSTPLWQASIRRMETMQQSPLM